MLSYVIIANINYFMEHTMDEKFAKELNALFHKMNMDEAGPLLSEMVRFNTKMTKYIWVTGMLVSFVAYFSKIGIGFESLFMLIFYLLGVLVISYPIILMWEKLMNKTECLLYALVPGVWGKRKKWLKFMGEWEIILKDKTNQYVLLKFLKFAAIKMEETKYPKEEIKVFNKYINDVIVDFNNNNVLTPKVRVTIAKAYRFYSLMNYVDEYNDFAETNEMPKEKEVEFNFNGNNKI